MKEGKSIAGYYCCRVCVCLVPSANAVVALSLNLSDGHWEALFIFS